MPQTISLEGLPDDEISLEGLPDDNQDIPHAVSHSQPNELVRQSSNSSGEWINDPVLGKTWKSNSIKPQRQDDMMFNIDTTDMHNAAANYASKLPRSLQNIGGFLLDLPVGVIDAASSILSDPLIPAGGFLGNKKFDIKLEREIPVASKVTRELEVPKTTKPKYRANLDGTFTKVEDTPRTLDTKKFTTPVAEPQTNPLDLIRRLIEDTEGSVDPDRMLKFFKDTADNLKDKAWYIAANREFNNGNHTRAYELVKAGLRTEESQLKLKTALGESVPLNKQQREIYRAERSEKFSRADAVNIQGESDVPKFFGALKGQHTRVDIKPLRESLDQNDIDELYRNIHQSPLSIPEKTNALTGLGNLLEGKVPTDYDIAQLAKVFGADFGKNLEQPRSLGRIALGLANNFKGLKSAGDFGLPFRQGRNYAYRQSWFKSLIPMMKSYGSQRIYDEKMAAIRTDPFFNVARDKMKVHFTELGKSINREEDAVGQFVGNLPLVKWSNRAATLFANQIRFLEAKKQYNLYKTAYESGMKLAKTADERSAAKLLNPDNPYVAARIGDNINTATGRGRLPGNLEKIAPELNATLFSPRLMASRIRSINRVLNPYSHRNPIERREAIKQLASIGAAGITELVATQQAMKLSGHDARIGLDPDSTDFMKLIIDDKTRYDPWGGYQQYFVPFLKIVMGTSTSTKGKQTDLNKKPFAQGGVGTLERAFIENKLAPTASLGANLMNRSEMGGRELNFTSPNPFENTLTRTLANPIILQDVYDVIKEDPTLAPLLGPDMFGQSIDVYEDR